MRYLYNGHAQAFYRPQGQLDRLNRRNGAPDTSYSYDAAQRLVTTALNAAGTAYDARFGFDYDPAGQAVEESLSNPVFAWDGPVTTQVDYAVNALDLYTSVKSDVYAYDDNGNLTSDGNTTYLYDVENRLVNVSGVNDGTLYFDPLGRLYEVSNDDTGDIRELLYDGDALVAEYNPSGTMLKRHVHGWCGRRSASDLSHRQHQSLYSAVPL